MHYEKIKNVQHRQAGKEIPDKDFLARKPVVRKPVDCKPTVQIKVPPLKRKRKDVKRKLNLDE